MTTARFTRLIGVPERSYRRWQQRQRQGQPVKGPWPTPSADRIEATALAYADAYPQWGSKTIAMLMRADGHYGPDATVYRTLKRNGRVLERNYQAERRQHAQARRAAFVVPPSGPNQVWQCDFTEFETRMGGTWRIGGIADYWSKLELGYHVATTQNHRDAIETVELALAETRRLYGRPLLDLVTDTSSGEIKPVALVTDNGPCFKSARFAAFVDTHPELIHIRTKRKSPGQNGVRERAFGSLSTSTSIGTRSTTATISASTSSATGSSSTRSGRTTRSPADARSTSTSKPARPIKSSSQPSPKPCHFREAGQLRVRGDAGGDRSERNGETGACA